MSKGGEIVHAFTTEFNGLARQLVNEIELSLPVDLHNSEVPTLFKTHALWDTGATNSVITADTVAKLGLKPISMTQVQHAGGVSTQNIHLVNIYLPNKVAIPFVQVTECEDISGNFGAIIGMDIISIGDFAVTNFQGKTTLSFRIPSVEKINFIPKNKIPNHMPEHQGRNELCNCGSGKKYKHCHGK